MSDRTERLKNLAQQRLVRQQERTSDACQSLVDEMSIYHRHNRRLFSSDIVERLEDKANGQCNWCSKPLRPADQVAIDHIFPISKGGTNEESNLQLLHKECNLKKGATLTHLSEDEIVQFLTERLDKES